MATPNIKNHGITAEVAVFSQPFRFEGFVRRPIYTVSTYGPQNGRMDLDGQPFKVGQVKAVELEEGTGVYWAVSRTTALRYPEGYPDLCAAWGVYHVMVDALRHKLPADLYQNPEIKPV